MTLDNKSEKIITAAIKIFAQKGLEKGKIADIAQEAGIGKGTVYEYFSSKEEIFNAIEEFVIDSMLSDLSGLLLLDLSPREKLKTLIQGTFDYMVNMGDGILIITELWAQSARGLWHGSFPTRISHMYREYQKMLVDVLEAGIGQGQFRKMHSTGVAVVLTAFLDGMLWQYLVLNDPEEFKQFWDEGVKSFFKGIEA